MKPTREQLVESQKKKNEREGKLIILRFYRLISLYLTKYFARTPLTPNQISFMGFLTVCLSSYFLTFSKFETNVLGLILLHLAQIFDCVDGEIARLKNLKSDFGYWFDGIASKTGEIFIYFSLTLAVFNSNNYGFLNKFFQNNSIYIWVLLILVLASRLLVVTASDALHVFLEEKYQLIASVSVSGKRNLFTWLRTNLFDYGLDSTYVILTLAVLIRQTPLLFIFLVLENLAVFFLVGLRLYRLRKPSK